MNVSDTEVTPRVAFAVGGLAGALAGPIALRVPSASGAALLLLAIGAAGVLAARSGAGAPAASCRRSGFVVIAAVVLVSLLGRATLLLPLVSAAILLLAPFGAAAFSPRAPRASGPLAIAGAALGTAAGTALAAAAWPGAFLLAAAGALLLALSAALERPGARAAAAASLGGESDGTLRAPPLLLGLAAGGVPFAWAVAEGPLAPFSPAHAGAAAAAWFLPLGLAAAAVAAFAPRRHLAGGLAIAAGASVALLFVPLERASEAGRMGSILARLALFPGGAGDAVAPFLAALVLLAPPGALLGGALGAMHGSRRAAAWPFLAGLPLGAFLFGYALPRTGLGAGAALAAAGAPAVAAGIALAFATRPARGAGAAALLAAAAAIALLAALAPGDLPPGVLRPGESVAASESRGAHRAAIVSRADGARRLLVDGDEAGRTDAPDAVLEANVAEIALVLGGPIERAGLAGEGTGAAAAALARRGVAAVEPLAAIPLAAAFAGRTSAPSPGTAEHVIAPPWRGRGAYAVGRMLGLLEPESPVASALERAPAGTPRTVAIPLESIDESLHATLLDRLAAIGYRSLFIAHPQALRPMAIVSTLPCPSLGTLRENLDRLPGRKPPLFADPLDFLTLRIADLGERERGRPPLDAPPIELAAAAHARRTETERALLAHRSLSRLRNDPTRASFFAAASEVEKRSMRERFDATTKLLEAHEIRIASQTLSEGAKAEASRRILAVEREAFLAAPDFRLANDVLADAVPALLHAGDYEEATALVATCLEKSPDYWRHPFHRGLIAYRLLDPEAAVPDFRRAAELAPDEAAAHAYLGAALYQIREPDAALAALERAVELDPGETLPWKPLGDLRAARGDFAGAVAALERALAISPGDAECARRLEECRARLAQK